MNSLGMPDLGINTLDMLEFRYYRINHSELFVDKHHHINGIARTRSYCRQHFRLFLLERHPMNIGKDEIIARENFWKEILMSRGGYGYNKN